MGSKYLTTYTHVSPENNANWVPEKLQPITEKSGDSLMQGLRKSSGCDAKSPTPPEREARVGHKTGVVNPSQELGA